ncbi:MAG TPA: phosphoglycerate dehydrogenase [Candidatus Limnocylindria bacterium]|nr:phosphoglycerate dehydrogenase [Candidatus Limnocylindria bacterium]
MTRLAVTPRSFRAVPGRHLQLLSAGPLEVRYPAVDRPLDEDEMIAFVAGCAALVVGLDPVSRRVLESGPLRVVVKYGSGLDNIDLDAAAELGVQVRATPGANSQGVAELTIGLLFALARHIIEHHKAAAEGSWERRLGRELAGARLGLVGYGQVGRRVAAMALGLGMEVVANDPLVRTAEVPLIELDELTGSCDAVSLHLPLTADTRGLVDRAFLRRMRRGAWLVNTARGGLVDFEALLEALREGQLGGAAVDDFETRPLPDSELWALPNFIASPHAGAGTYEAAERTGVAAVEAVLELIGARLANETEQEE